MVDHKLDILEEQVIRFSIEEFIKKENCNAILKTIDKMVKKQQKVLVKRRINNPYKVEDLMAVMVKVIMRLIRTILQ